MTSPPAERPQPCSELVPSLARGIDEAGYAIFRACASGTDNTVVSPASIGLAFGMADAGASGQLAVAIAAGFGLPASGRERLAAFNAYQQRLSTAPDAASADPATGEAVEPPTVVVANRVFTDAGDEPRPEYREVLATWFGAGAESVPLRTEPGAAAERMNAWVDEHTQGLVRDLFAAESFSEASRLVLLNALAMTATWRDELLPEDTEDEPFTRLDGSQVDVPLMDATATAAGVAEIDGGVAAALAYAGGQLEMVVIVPESGRFEQMRDRMGTALMEELDLSWLHSGCTVRLPRFEAASTVALRDVMADALGVEGLFDTDGLDGIGDHLQIADAIHATSVIVDEKGTEAAAVTGIGIALTGAPLEWLDVRADQPFLYVIRDVDTGAALFVGQVLDPSP
ncbi:serpin family protein [Demequina activiva]|nr:serpin family protein [Demequina activiva]